MQHYVKNSYNIMQHYVIRGDISPHFRRLVAVSDRFCGNNLVGIQCCMMVYNMRRLLLYVGDNVTKRAKNDENVA